MKVETVKIVNSDSKTGFIIINKSDMKDSDKLFLEKKSEKKSNK